MLVKDFITNEIPVLKYCDTVEYALNLMDELKVKQLPLVTGEGLYRGMVASIYKNGRIDVPYIASTLGRSEDEVSKEIINSGLGFEDPVSREIEVVYEYLSGNVREKLAKAKEENKAG